MTLEEAWSGQQPDVQHLRVFRCIAFAHVPDQKRTKLDDKANKCVFMGVSRESKDYKLYNPISKMVIINRDVVFDEDNFWSWVEKPNNQQLPLDLDNGDKEQKQPVADEGASTLVNQEGTSFRPQRNRRRPLWMADYEVSGNV
ncbi:hypothetical protein KY284_035670 [Solanum tuberosum]|nr:hypothetical protein KY284_035670 [Solanum tuberosum]